MCGDAVRWRERIKLYGLNRTILRGHCISFFLDDKGFQRDFQRLGLQ